MTIIDETVQDEAVYAGRSPQTGRPFFVAPESDTSALTLQEALTLAEHTSRMTGAHYRLPTRGELSVMFRASLAADSDWHWTKHTGGFRGDPMVVRGRDHRTATHPAEFRHRVRLVRDM